MGAHTIADSKLVKTAFFGEDANWGRIIGALGRSGAIFDQEKVDIFFDDVQMVGDGLGLGAVAETAATEVLKISFQWARPWLVTRVGIRLFSIRMAIIMYSPALGACTPRLLVRATPRGNQSKGTRCSTPAPQT